MNKTNNKQLAFIIFDGIENSVFVSQVLQPLLNLLKEDNNIEITLISFEKKRPSNEFLINLIPAHDRLHFVLCRKLSFWGKSSLLLPYLQLLNLFEIIPIEKIITRGPLAGWITIKALKKTLKQNLNKISITIQARGLCAEEYRFANQYVKTNFLKKLFQKFIYNKLHQIEYETYKEKRNINYNIKIESVSQSLKEYLVHNFNACSLRINIATRDIPKKMNFKQIQEYKKEIRKKLGILNDQPVYCYSGSFKPWQCIPQIIEYFSEQYKKNSKSFLLLLSQDKKEIEKILLKNKISKKNYALLSVDPKELHKYLAASNFGLLFRNKDIINWVSRPTKMLEYQAVGLKIIHNQTISWLENQNQNQSFAQF